MGRERGQNKVFHCQRENSKRLQSHLQRHFRYFRAPSPVISVLHPSTPESLVLRPDRPTPKAQISIDSRLLSLTTEFALRTEPASQCWTNAQGMRAWILSAEDLASLRRQLKNLPGDTTANVMRLTTYDGGQAQISDGGPSAPATNSVFIGLTIDLLPRVAGSSFNLLVAAISTSLGSSPEGTTVEARTNFAAACQVLLPNGGCLVVDVGKGKDSSSTNYWLIISP